MRMGCGAFSIVLAIMTPVDQDVPIPSLSEQLLRPFPALMDLPAPSPYSRDAVKAFRSGMEQERDERIEASEREIERLEEDLETARRQLQVFNGLSSRDDPAVSERRSRLHIHIAAAEQLLRERKLQKDRRIPAAFEIKLAKLRIIEEWPERRQGIDRRIADGLARQRVHGDIEDIGYRRIAEDAEEDIASGEQAIRQMTSTGLMPREILDPAVQDYVLQLASKIAESSDLRTPLRVSVLESPEVHAAGLPGGFVLVTSGLIQAAESESELAGVLANEIARIAARHAARASRRSILSRIVMPVFQAAAAIFTGGVTSPGAYYGVNYGLQGLGILVDKALAGSAEKYQEEADRLGIQYAWKAGFDPMGYVAFLDSTTRQENRNLLGGYSPTPALGRRLIDSFSEIRFLTPNENPIVDSEEFQKAKQRLQAVATVQP
jgi:hypothetical protein